MKVLHLYISPGHNFFGRRGDPPGDHPAIEVPEIECVAGHGIRGDRFFDYKPDYQGQITFFANSVFQQLCRHLAISGKEPSVLRRNVILDDTAGLDHFIGREFEIQGIRFFGAAECAPCHWMDHAFAPGAEEFLKGRGGLRARILSSGILRRDTPAK